MPSPTLKYKSSFKPAICAAEQAIHDEDARLHRFFISSPCAIRRWDALVGLTKAASTNIASPPIVTATIVE